jgi:diguanylate cyclase (GGDEF)-like protein
VRSILGFSIRYPRATILVLVALTAIFSTQLHRLQFNISAQSLMVKNDPLWLAYQQSLKTFGSDNVVIIYIHDKTLFDPQKLALIQQLNKDLQDLSFVKSSSSLFNVPNVKERDEYIITDAFLKVLPTNESQAQEVINDALNNPLVAQNLISSDGKSMAINLSLDGAIHYPGLDQKIASQIEQILQPLTQKFEVVYQIGSPYVRNEISKQIQVDQKSILPAALIVLIIVLGISLKSLNSALIPLITAIMSIIMTLSLMAISGIPINVLTSIIPALLIIIGSTEDVHLIAQYNDGIQNGLSRKEAAKTLPVSQSLAISLAFLTTFIGFLSITISDLDLLREFGALVAIGLLINFLITVLFVPAYLSLFGVKKSSKSNAKNFYQHLGKTIFKLVIRFKKSMLLLLCLILIYFSWGIQYLEVNNNSLAYFSDDSVINQRANTIHENLSGMQTFSIILDSNIDDTFLKVRYLHEIERIQQFLTQRNVFDKSFSFADFIKLTNKIMEDSTIYELPEEDEVVQAYMGLVQFSTVKDYVNESFSSARILIRHNIASSKQLEIEFNKIKEFIEDELNSKLKISFTGESVLTNRAADSMAFGQIQSLILMIIVIFLLVSLLFIDIRAGLLALVPNVFPVMILFGVMGHFNIPLDTGTTMVAIIALGICVDDTIHFLSRYHFNTRGTDNVEQALLKTVEHEATPITTTSVALALGFSTLTLSSFQPVANFGALSALVMILALFSTFILTPILLSYTKLITVWDMISLKLKSAVLKKSIIFQGMNNIQIKKTILSGNIKQFDDEDIMVEQGSSGSDMYVILEGHARVTHKERDGSIHTLGYLNAGELFGEISLLSNLKRTARVTADPYAKVLIIKWQSITEMNRFHPRISMKLFQNLSRILSQRMASKPAENELFHDELTGAMTKPFFYEQLKLELDRSQRYKENLSAIIMDFDLLGLNSTGNILVTEKAISALTQVLRQQSRRVDIFARWNEFRFIIALPRTSAERALTITQRMKQAIEQTEFPDIGRVHISAAITETDGSDEIHNLIQRMELKLDDMKQNDQSLHVTLVN